MDASDNLVVVGRISAAYGIKGWVKIRSFTQPMDNIFTYLPWRIKLGGRWKELQVDNFRSQGKGLVVHFDGVDDRTEAEKLNGIDIYVRQDQFSALEKNEFYWHQLQGLNVYSTFGAERVLLGVMSEFLETGANDVLVVKPVDGSLDQRERLIPYVDMYLDKVDPDAGEILVDWDPAF